MADWRKASKSFQKELLSHKGGYTREAERLFTTASEKYLQRIEPLGGIVIPYSTGNLLDSIGIRILRGNTLVGYRTMVETTYVQHATKPQHMKGIYPIWGEVEIEKRIHRPSRRADKGVVAQLMVGVPYAEEVDKTHDYFEFLQHEFETSMIQAMAALATYKAFGVKTSSELL